MSAKNELRAVEHDLAEVTWERDRLARALDAIIKTSKNDGAAAIARAALSIRTGRTAIDLRLVELSAADIWCWRVSRGTTVGYGDTPEQALTNFLAARTEGTP